MEDKITTIKLLDTTKLRLEHLRIYKRETYDEILQKMLQLLNLTKVNPEAAREKLRAIDRKNKAILKNKSLKYKQKSNQKEKIKKQISGSD